MHPLSAEARCIMREFGNPDVVNIINPRPIYSIDVTGGGAEYPDMDKLMETIKELSAKTWIVNATEEEKMGGPIFANSILIGALIGSGVLPLDETSVEPILQETFPKEIEANMKAFSKGMELVRQ